MSAPLLLRNALLLDAESGDYQETDILAVDGLVAETGTGLAAPASADTVNVHGAHVLPGLIDCHVHVTAINADLGGVATLPPSYVAAGAIRRMGAMLDRGFTTVRDTGGGDAGLANAQAEGVFRGPRLFYGGRGLSQTGGHGDKVSRGVRRLDDHPCCAGSGQVVDGVDAVRVAARDELRKGAHHIKVHASGGVSSPSDRIGSTQYSMDELRAVVEEAEGAGCYVTAHAYPARAVNRALEAGIRCIEHGNLIDDSSIELFRKTGAFLVPTLVTYRALKEEGRRHGLPEESWQKVDEVLDHGLGALESAHRAGVNIAYGTDLLGEMNRRQNEEFRIRAEVLKPIDVIRSATVRAAELLRMTDRLGTLAPGAFADLIVLDGDPVDDIGILTDPEQHLRLVVQGGVVVSGSPVEAGSRS